VIDPINRLDSFHSDTMGYPLAEAKPGETNVVASERHLREEEGYGVVFAFWLLLIYDRCVVSVRPDLEESVERIAEDASDARELFTEAYTTRIDQVCKEVLPMDIAGRLFQSQSYVFYVDDEHFRPFRVPGCRCLTVDDHDLIRQMTGESKYGCPEESLQDGTAFGVICMGKGSSGGTSQSGASTTYSALP